MRWLGALALLCAGPAAAGCGDEAGPCRIEGGEYHAVVAASEQPTPTVVFLHGAGGNGGASIRNAALMGELTGRGYTVLAPTASRPFGGGWSWNFLPQWTGRDEPAFLRAVVKDAQTRFGTRPDEVLLAGFSAGAFMVTYLACSEPETFTAYAPVAGGFWLPMPETCAGPVDLFQTQGWNDGVVPIEGRILGGGRYRQGDIFAGLDLWRETNACPDGKPSSFSQNEAFLRRAWACDGALEMALFPGGHVVPEGWADMVLDWFEALPR